MAVGFIAVAAPLVSIFLLTGALLAEKAKTQRN